jgi:hypothetical protein
MQSLLERVDLLIPGRHDFDHGRVAVASALRLLRYAAGPSGMGASWKPRQDSLRDAGCCGPLTPGIQRLHANVQRFW